MVNQKRLIDLFKELVAIDSPSLGERQMCDRLKAKLNELGIEAYEDNTGKLIGGNSGNLYAYIDGGKDLEPIMFSSHMDTVEPSHGKTAIVHEDGRITSDGTTVLGSDDLAGVCAIIEALRVLKENGEKFRPVEVVFTVSEETHCMGASHAPFDKIKSKECYVFDLSGDIGEASNKAPTIITYTVSLHGKAAHAAFKPESGVHALKCAAEIITKIRCGKYDGVTVNIGTINGGTATNVVAEHTTFTGEVRSFDNALAQAKLNEITDIINTVAKEYGAEVKIESETCVKAYDVDENHPVAIRFKNTCEKMGITPSIVETYGGSDNNQYVPMGINGLVVSTGMNNCHSCDEYTTVDQLTNAAKLALALMRSED
ncbi:MAG: M20/M25/M40 family metallo-hydrolase [Ruminococcaceae bacterium]|jgi:tripeptide aminopeptidase|nr:M20/M25/M40 family metallo-hydrolase [Oscillospiraceae bacterium]